jgi:hypothetical protein
MTNPLEALLRSAVQDLALPPELGLARKGAGTHRPDELALEFDDVYAAFVSNAATLPTEKQLLALQALDSALAAMSGPEHASLWTESAVKSHPSWVEVRSLAAAVLEAFAWPPGA